MALGSGMRSLCLIPALLLAACATSAPNTSSSKAASLELPQMKSGECGLFGWTTDEKRSFVFYADEDEAKYAPQGQVIKLAANEAFPTLDYTDPEGRPVIIKLGQGEPLVGGTRYPFARITSKTADGWDRVMPIALVRSCQSSASQ